MKVLKSLSETIWSARVDEVIAWHQLYCHKQILQALTSIAEDTEQPRETRNEAIVWPGKYKICDLLFEQQCGAPYLKDQPKK